jgi:outer membrane protein TolC
MKPISIFFLSALLLTMSAVGQEKLSLTIDKAIEIGLENSKVLKTSQFKVIAAEAKSSETDALGLPSLKFNGAYTRLSAVPASAIPNFITPGGPPIVLSPSVVDNYSLKATVAQPLFTGGKLSGAADATEYSAEAVKKDFSRDRADVIYSIKAAYWNLYGAIEARKFVDENVDQIRSHVADTENLMKQGLLTTNDVLKVQVQLSDALVRQINARNGVQLAVINLDNTLGLPLTTDIELASTIDVQDRQWPAIDQLVQRAFDARPDVMAMNARVKASEAGLSSARGGWWPQVYLVGNYNYLRPNPRIFPTKDEFKDTWDVSLSVSFDIWNWNQTGSQTTQAQAAVSQTQEGLSMLKDGVTLEVTQSYLAVNQAKERKAVAEQGVAQAEENYRVMSEKYKTGLVPNLELKDAETALLQAKLTLTQSLVDYELAMARLSKAVGE